LILNGYSKEELVELCLISCRALEKKWANHYIPPV
jgi:hypothetical protein